MDIRQAVDLIAREGRGHFSVSLNGAEWFVTLAVGWEEEDHSTAEYATVVYRAASSFEEAQRGVYEDLGFPRE